MDEISITHISQYFLPYKGGQENRIWQIGKRLSSYGYSINVITSRLPNTSLFEIIDGIKVFRSRTLFKIYNTPIFPISEVFRRVKTDIIEVHIPNLYTVEKGCYLSKKYNLPLVITFHHEPKGYNNLTKIISRVWKLIFYDNTLNYATKIITPTKRYIHECKYLWKVKDKVVVIPNGVDLELFRPLNKTKCKNVLHIDENELNILYVGKLEEYKGISYLIRAIGEISNKNKNIRLTIVGKGKKRIFQELCRKLGVKAIFLEDIPEKELPIIYSSADVFVLPTVTTEGFGIVILEAMACGVPVVATNVGGIPEIVEDGENGLLVPPKSSTALSNAIIYLLENDEVRNKMKRRGLKKVREYSWDIATKKTKEVYEDIIK